MEKQRNILLVCKSLTFISRDGKKDNVRNIGRDLVNMGHEVTILWEGSLSGCENSYIKEGVIHTELPYFSGGFLKIFDRQVEELFFSTSAMIWVRRNEHEFDIIQILGKNGYLHKCNIHNSPIALTISALTSEKQKIQSPIFGKLFYSISQINFRKSKREMSHSTELLESS